MCAVENKSQTWKEIIHSSVNWRPYCPALQTTAWCPRKLEILSKLREGVTESFWDSWLQQGSLLPWHLLKVESEGHEKSNFKITTYYFYIPFSTHFQNAGNYEVDYINSLTFLQCECVSFSFSKCTSVSQRETLLSSFCRHVNRVPNKPWQGFQIWAFFNGF